MGRQRRGHRPGQFQVAVGSGRVTTARDTAARRDPRFFRRGLPHPQPAGSLVPPIHFFTSRYLRT
jgi:hypothetical protein